MASIAHWIETCRSEMERSGLHYGHGTDNAGDEAAWLVLHTLGQRLDGSFSDWGKEVGASKAEEIQHLLDQRITTRQPLAYLLGEAWFCGLPFLVNSDVLVPRSPIAELINTKFQPWFDAHRHQSALDLCTGSGCIAVAMALAFPGLTIDASDISPEALQLARANVDRHGLADRVSLVQSDGFRALTGRVYDLVVSNPPYVPTTNAAGLPGEFLAEPEIGLFSGSDGMELPLTLLADAPDFLNPEGVFFMEVGAEADRLQELLPKTPFIWLEFEHGGEGIFTMGRSALLEARPMIRSVLEQRRNVR